MLGMHGEAFRTEEPIREQARMALILEDSLPVDHPARVIWNALGTLDLSPLLAGAKSRRGHAGRARLSPRMLLTLWMYAISEGIGSAREIEKQIQTDAAFGWICGDLKVGRTALSEFRKNQGEAFDALLSEL